MYIHSLVARALFCCTFCLHTSAHCHACAHTRMAQGHVKKVFVACVSSLSILLFLLTFHNPCCSLRVTSRPSRHHVLVHFLAEFHRPESAGHAQLLTLIDKFGDVPKSDANTSSTKLGQLVFPGYQDHKFSSHQKQQYCAPAGLLHRSEAHHHFPQSE